MPTLRMYDPTEDYPQLPNCERCGEEGALRCFRCRVLVCPECGIVETIDDGDGNYEQDVVICLVCAAPPKVTA